MNEIKKSLQARKINKIKQRNKKTKKQEMLKKT